MSHGFLLPLSIPCKVKDIDKRLLIIEYTNDLIQDAPQLPTEEISRLCKAKLDNEVTKEDLFLIEKIKKCQALVFNNFDRSLLQICLLIDRLQDHPKGELYPVFEIMNRGPRKSKDVKELQGELKKSFDSIYRFIPYMRSKLAILELIAFITEKPDDLIRLLELDLEYLSCPRITELIITVNREALAQKRLCSAKLDKIELSKKIKKAFRTKRVLKLEKPYWEPAEKVRSSNAFQKCFNDNKSITPSKKVLGRMLNSEIPDDEWSYFLNDMKSNSTSHTLHLLQGLELLESPEGFLKMIRNHKIDYYFENYPTLILANRFLPSLLDLTWTHQTGLFATDHSFRYLNNYKFII